LRRLHAGFRANLRRFTLFPKVSMTDIRPGIHAASLFLVALLASLVSPPTNAQTIEPVPELKKHFDAQGVVGTFVLFDLTGDRMQVYDEARAKKRYAPASTFKIANALIGLDMGAVKDIDEVLPYGGKPQLFKHWERDMSLRDGMKVSSVPVYQELARRIGLARMEKAVKALDYGNAAIGDRIDRFWLGGPLEISAIEQTRFLARLTRGELPVKAEAMRSVKEMILQERTEAREVYYKTGWLFHHQRRLGWLVGWVVKDGRTYVFALNIDPASDQDTTKRWPLAKACLEALGRY
jgi:beta-lactamase class D